LFWVQKKAANFAAFFCTPKRKRRLRMVND